MYKDRKKEHKKVIKYMRMRNKQLAADDYIGLNRFRIDLFSEKWFRFEDGSGGVLSLTFKLTDTWTNNTAYFICDNYDYQWRMFDYLNDFLIRCSSGRKGHWPPLHYIAYDVHEIKPYAHFKEREINIEPKDGIINKYNWTRWELWH